MNKIEIYQTLDNEARVEVKFEQETVWLTQEQLVTLFQRDQSVISRHIRNIFTEKELEKESNMQKMHIANSDKPVSFYNLDVIISVGYRVKSQRGVQFRQWATQRLKDYLIKGFAINKKRLEELNKVVEIIQNSNYLETSQISEAKGLLDILSKYTKSFALLNQYDGNTIELKELNDNITYEITYKDATAAIHGLKQQLINQKEASTLFGKQKDKSFEGILKSVTQTFDGDYLYPTIEEQASHLLYFIIKNHPFVDGNKRIGAFMFVWFLEKNKHLLKLSGEAKMNDNALTALALLVAQSDPGDKNLMTKLICNLITND